MTVPMKVKYKQAIEWLDHEYVYFLTHVLKIGRPEPANWIPTACVAVNREGKDDDAPFDPTDFRFYFNEKFSDELDVESMAFILAHETLHVVLNHLKLQQTFVDHEAIRKVHKKGGVRKATKEENKAKFQAEQDAKLFNIAADCVINDYLIENGMAINGEFSDQMCRGEKWIGANAAFLTVTDVFERLKKQQEQNKKDDDGEGEDGQGQGQGGKFVMADGSEGEYTELDSHDWLLDPDAAEKMADAIDEFNKRMDEMEKMPADIEDKKALEDGDATEYQKALDKAMRAGNKDSNMEGFVRESNVNIAWAKLLDELDPDMFKTEGIAPPMISSFHRRPRKLGAKAFRGVNLPVYRREERINRETNEIPSIVLCLDVSGSIGPRDAERFVALARTIPQNRIKLFPMVFQTTYQKIDLENPKYSQGGGTNFDAIYHFIENEVKPELKGKSPKAVVIITDGEARMQPNYWPTEEEAEMWLWLISPSDRSTYSNIIGQRGTKKMLNEYIA